MKKEEIIDGMTIKYHANGETIWSKGKVIDGQAEGYWEWFRIDGTIKRSGNFINGLPMIKTEKFIKLQIDDCQKRSKSVYDRD